MAKSYTITLKLDGSGTSAGATEAVAGATSSSASARAKASKPPGSGPDATAMLRSSFAKGLVAYHTLKSFAVQQINYTVSTVGLRTGSTEMQQRATFINNVVQKGIGIAEMSVVGAVMGGLPGALAGLVLSTTHTVTSYYQKANTLNLQETLENRSLEMMRIRAGTLGSRSYNQ